MNEEAESDTKKKKKRAKIEKHQKRVIISHPAIYKKLKLTKDDCVRVVTANWIFDCIEQYEVVPFDRKYIVKPNQAQSMSPTH